MRKETNKEIHKELMKLMIYWMKEKRGNVSFIDMEGVLDQERFYARDGVHVSDAGHKRMG